MDLYNFLGLFPDTMRARFEGVEFLDEDAFQVTVVSFREDNITQWARIDLWPRGEWSVEIEENEELTGRKFSPLPLLMEFCVDVGRRWKEICGEGGI